MNFVDNTFKKEILNNVTNRVFPKLNPVDKNYLTDKLVEILNITAIKFNFNIKKYETYKKQFRVNNYRDSISFLLLLLPFIDDPDGTKKGDIESISDIYVAKHDHTDINSSEPKYIYSNIQYGRCVRGKSAQEIKFSYEHIEHNYILLKDTIQRCANKLFVNWIDIFPVAENTDDDRFMMLIKKTREAQQNSSLKEWNYADNDDTGLKYQGIPVEDIYNVFSNYLFASIKNYKWLIYDINYNNEIFPYFILIQKLLYLNNCIRDVSYYANSDAERSLFDESVKNLIICISKYSECNELPQNVYFKIVIAMMYFYNKYSKNKQEAQKNGYKSFEADYLDEEETNLDRLRMQYIYPSLKSLKPEYIYEFLRYQFKKIKRSYYNASTDSKKDEDNRLIEPYSEYIKKTDPATKYPYYDKLGDEEIILTHKNFYNFAKSLTHKTVDGDYKSMGRVWKELTEEDRQIFISRINSTDTDTWFNIGRYLKRLNIKNPTEYNKNLLFFLTSLIPQVVVQALTVKGTLTYFDPKPDVSSLDFKDIPNKVQEFFNKNMNTLKDCFHFLTDAPYADISIKTKDDELDYFKYTTKYQKWYTTYAMNWVSQISFFHRYFNCRVMMVTGSTGVGKSTQIPKLLMYALKAVDYKEDGTVVCTQPRISPTEGNAKRIAEELAVPIQTYSEKYRNSVPLGNFYVQYKHQDDSHTDIQENLSLKIVTDGTLLAELNNPTLKKRKYDQKQKKYEYYEDNIYDIVIVDEAHEHNTNMDVILTLMKYATYHNNDIKLIIISATMDEDEPVYRRYYRDINDNLKNPINYELKKYVLDRINVDRRLHISPPGMSTRFKIDEIYKPNEDPVNVVMSLVAESTSGDILLFQPGEREIREAVEKLNSMLPGNILAVPYVSKMDKNKRNIVENIDSKKHVLSRSTPYDFFMTSEDPPHKGDITRAIIVATNIAEASITISTLRYVVDTGTQKIAKYDYKTGETSLLLRPISESSRLQRKGRVGRTASGTVVYMYEKGAMENNKTPYKISIDNISTLIYSLIRETSDEYPFETKKIITDYLGNNDHYDYQNNTPPHIYYDTGYSEETIIDNNGTFFIVHPEELNFGRNITGKIVNRLSNEIKLSSNTIYSPKMDSFMDKLQMMWCLLRKDKSIIKTQFGIYLFRLKERLKIDDPRMLISYLFSRQYGVDAEMQAIISILTTCKLHNASPSRWFETVSVGNRYVNSFVDLQPAYKSNSDLIGLFNVLKDVLPIETNINKNEDFAPLTEFKIRYLENRELPFTIFIMLRKLDIKGELSKKREFTEKEKKLLIKDNNYADGLKDFDTNIRRKKLNQDIVQSYRKTYLNLQHSIFKKMKGIYDTDLDLRPDDVDIKWFDDILSKFKTKLDFEDAITRSLLHGYSSIASFIRKDLYIDMLNPDLTSLSTIKKFHPKLPIRDSLVTEDTSMILYFMKNSESNEISIINKVTAEQIVETNPLPVRDAVLKKRYEQFLAINWEQVKDTEKVFGLSTDIKLNIQRNYRRLIKSKNKDFWRKITGIVNKDQIKFVKFTDS